MRYSLFAICMLSGETPGREQDAPIDILSRSSASASGHGLGSLESPALEWRNVNALHSYRWKTAQLEGSYWSSWHIQIPFDVIKATECGQPENVLGHWFQSLSTDLNGSFLYFVMGQDQLPIRRPRSWALSWSLTGVSSLLCGVRATEPPLIK